jgi:hypothetical protein
MKEKGRWIASAPFFASHIGPRGISAFSECVPMVNEAALPTAAVGLARNDRIA